MRGDLVHDAQHHARIVIHGCVDHLAFIVHGRRAFGQPLAFKDLDDDFGPLDVFRRGSVGLTVGVVLVTLIVYAVLR